MLSLSKIDNAGFDFHNAIEKQKLSKKNSSGVKKNPQTRYPQILMPRQAEQFLKAKKFDPL